MTGKARYEPQLTLADTPDPATLPARSSRPFQNTVLQKKLSVDIEILTAFVS